MVGSTGKSCANDLLDRASFNASSTRRFPSLGEMLKLNSTMITPKS